MVDFGKIKDDAQDKIDELQDKAHEEKGRLEQRRDDAHHNDDNSDDPMTAM